jgi:hypothetical protein
MTASNLISDAKTFVILTDVQISHPTIVCPITAILTPAAAYISLSANFSTISVYPSYIVQPTDIGTH